MRGERVILMLSLMASACAAYGAGNVNGAVGVRQLDEDQWEPVDQQLALAVLADFALGESLPVYAAVGIQVSAKQSSNESVDYTGSVADLTVGLKLMPRDGSFRPYVGAGIASVGASFEADYFDFTEDDTDQSFGYYLNAGVLFRTGQHFNVGIDLRTIRGTEITLFNAEGDADSVAASFFMGYGWN